MTWGEILEDLKNCPLEAEVSFWTIDRTELEYLGATISNGSKKEVDIDLGEK